ncbi:MULTISPECIES: response regulator [Chitinophaga]|uniref:response regulator n=1 Tax=Chitinophaga TaxID=79328 RepID=UPI000BAE8A8D|nr:MULTISPECIES: response regulator [Chitinophaga]ASZ15045.1 response regulator [Chitinophaga sp. MD30]
MKVLIIDDDTRNIFALRAVLRSRGFEILTANGAEEGIHLLLQQQQPVNVVLMDIMMPDMDGYEAIGRIRAEAGIAQTPVVAVTAQAMVGDREKCLAAGANAYISKPIDIDDLLKILAMYQ